LKEATEWEDKDDGTFWMNIGDFKKYFSDLNICKYHDNFEFSFLEHRGECGVFKIEIQEEGRYTFGIT